MIYLIQAGDNGPVKIGVSDNPEQRLRDLQTAHSETLVLLDKIDANHSNERNLHTRLAEHRIKGEWFRPHEEVFGVFEASKVMAMVGSDYDDGLCPYCNILVNYGFYYEHPDE